MGIKFLCLRIVAFDAFGDLGEGVLQVARVLFVGEVAGDIFV